MKSSARLGVKNNLSPCTPPGEASGAAGTNSAALAKAERQIKALQEENKLLKDEFSEISTLYHQLVREASHEKYDERRVMLLKAYVIQLERQMMQLAESQASRAATLMEVENALAGIADCVRSHLAEDKAVGSNVGSTSMPRAALTGIVESAESARIKLYKNIESSNPEKLERPLLMMDRFIKQSSSQAVTLMDVCSGKMEHLNLKHVSKLESQLAQLYKQLMLVNRGLYSIRSSSEKRPSANREVPGALYDRLGADVSRACTQLNTVTRDLLDLTLLVPAAPWPPLQRPRIQELTTDDVIRALPSFPRSKAAEGRHLVEALLKCYTLNSHMTNLENQALSEELKFHQCVYDLQQEYCQSLFAALREGYAEFEESTQKLICSPLSDVLKNYSVLRSEASEEALRDFLAVFKQHADQLEDAVQVLKPNENKNLEGGKAALSEYGDQFLKSLNHIHADCQKKRDKLISDLEEVKGQQQEHSDELKELFRRREEEAERDVAEEYAEITRRTAELSLDAGGKDAGSTRNTRQGADARGRRRASQKVTKHDEEDSMCSCGAEDAVKPSKEKATGTPGSGTPGSGTPGFGTLTSVRRPTSLGDLSTPPGGEVRRTPPTPKGGRLTSRGGIPTPSPVSTPGSRIPTQGGARGGVRGGGRGRGRPTGRLAPIAKLALKPRTGERDASPADGPRPSPSDDDEQ